MDGKWWVVENERKIKKEIVKGTRSWKVRKVGEKGTENRIFPTLMAQVIIKS